MTFHTANLNPWIERIYGSFAPMTLVNDKKRISTAINYQHKEHWWLKKVPKIVSVLSDISEKTVR